MPYEVRKKGKKYQVVNSDTGEVRGTHPTRARANRQLRALYANVEDAKSTPINDKTVAFMSEIIQRDALKVGARNNANDRATIQAIHDNACDLGAECKPMDMNEGITAMLNAKSIKGMMDLGALAYARQEGWDIVSAAQVLAQVAQMCQSELSELVHLDQLSGIMRELCKYITDEVDEMNSAASEAVEEETEEESAESMAMMSAPAEVKQADGLKLDYVKSLGINVPNLAVKFVAKDEIRGYTFLWGNPDLTDLEREYFTKQTNFWDDILGKSPRPLTWDHAQDPDFKASPIIGQIVDFGDDEIGRWYVAKLDRAHAYNRAVAELIKKSSVGTSADSAPQYVTRVKTGKSIWLKEWAWFASALTDTPCEPRMIGSLEFLKSLGVALPDTSPEAWQAEKAKLDFLKLRYLGD